jgi:putative peptidoglycan lipid II flippase
VATAEDTQNQQGRTGTGSLARSTAIMSVGTLVSRLTGVIRLAVIVATLGVAETRLTDAYNIANSAPNIIYELVLGGVVTSVFVPLFVELLEKETRERAWEVMSAVLNLSLLVLSVITVIGILAAPWIAHFYALRLEGNEMLAQQRVITFLLRLFIPQIILYGLYFIVAGMLNATKRFGPPMFTPILNNLVVIAAFLWFQQMYGVVTLESATTSQLLLIGLGTTLSVAPMGLALLPYLRRVGSYRLTLSVDHPSIKKLLRLSVFVVGFVVANQLGYLVIQWLANAQQGAFSAYISASTFFLMPIGLFVWSLTTALLPTLSRHAVHDRWDEFRSHLSLGVRATLFLMIPATVGYLILARPMVRVLLEHGVMTSRSTDLVATVLTFLVLGLVQFSLFQLFVRAFYATQDTKTPFLINCAVIGLNTAINVPMFAWAGAKGLAAGQAIAYTVGVALHVRLLGRRIGGLEGRRLTASALRISGAAGAMAAVVWLSWRAVASAAPMSGVMAEVLELGVPVVLGVVAYLAAAHVLKVEELDYVKGLIARRPGRTPRDDQEEPAG